MATTWRARSMNRARGAYWLLESGRARNRRTVSLRYVTEAQASTALARIQAEEDAGTVARVFALHAEDPDAAIRYLLGDDAIADLLPEGPVDYASMTVETYFDEVFWPVRSDPASPIGIGASTAAIEAVYWRHKGGRDRRGPRRGILDGEIGQTRLRDLDDVLWERWQTSQTQLSGRAKVLRRNAYAALLSYARRMGHIAYRPEFFRIKGSTKATRAKADPLNLEEVLALLEVATPMRRALWAVGVGQGLRPGELVRVHWEDVDWDTRVLSARGTKTEASDDAIPMTPPARARPCWCAPTTTPQGVVPTDPDLLPVGLELVLPMFGAELPPLP